MVFQDMKKNRVENERKLQELRRVTFCIGINVTAPSKYKDIPLRALAIFILVGSAITIYANLCNVYYHFDDFFNVVESICIVLQVGIAASKLFYMCFVQRKFYQLLEIVIDHRLLNEIPVLDLDVGFTETLRTEIEDILKVCWKRAMLQVNLYLTACSTVISFYFFGAISVNVYHGMKETANFTNLHVTPTYYPFWADKDNNLLYYTILTVWDTTGLYLAGMGAYTFDGLYFVMVMHAVALLQSLKRMIIFSTSKHVAKDKRVPFLRDCIIFYDKVFRFCTELRELFAVIALMQLIESLICFGFVLFQGSLGLENDKKTLLRMVLYMIAASYEVVLFCYGGQNLTAESETMPFAWYSAEWYNESREYRKTICMMIMRTNKPIFMWAWNFVTLTLPTFQAIMKTSGSYFLMLQNLSHD